MCLIVVKPKNSKSYLNYERFCMALDTNPHSIGILYKKDNKIKVKKFVKPKDIKKKIFNIIKNKDEYAIHFRYATHGSIDTKNCHPFRVVDGLYLMHNGILSKYGDMNKNQSDTRNFIDYYLKPIIEKYGIDIIYTEEFKKEVEKEIGFGNKIVLIDNDFNYVILNENAGAWINDNWLSNTYSTKDFDFKTYSDKEMEENYDNYICKWYDEETIKFLEDKELDAILSEPFGYYDDLEKKFVY